MVQVLEFNRSTGGMIIECGMCGAESVGAVDHGADLIFGCLGCRRC